MDQDNGYFCVNSTANLTPAKTKDKDIEDKVSRRGYSSLSKPEESDKSSVSSTLKENLQDLDKKWNALLLLTGLATTIGCSLPVGYNIGVLNTPQGILKQWCNESIINSYNYHLDPAQLDILWSTIVSIFLIGGMIGSLAGSLLADKIGRKGALSLGGTVGVLAACLFIGARFTSRVELMLLGRFLIGLSSGLTTGVMPMYLCEIAPTSLRAAMGVLCPLGLTFGVVFSQVMGLDWLLGTENTWHYLLALYAALILLCGTVIPCLPESPKYLFQVKGLKQKAAKELARLRRQPVQNVMTELEGQTGKNQTEPWSVMRVITTSSLRLPLALVCALQFGQQTSGINAVFYYSIDIFKSAGLSQETAQYANLGAGVINFIIAVTMIPIVSQLPHRILTVTSCFLSTIMLFSLTICISYIEFFSWMAYMAIFSVLFYVLVYGLGLGPIPYFIGTELFDMGPRPAAMALGSVANWTGNFAVGMVFPLLQRFMGAYSFLIFAFFTALLTVFLKLCLPETNTKYRDSEAVPHATVQAPSHLPSTSQKKSERMLFQSIQDL